LNGDGFGLAWYAPEVSAEPALFKDITPAWNNMNLLSLSRVTRSSCILAHVRAATPGLAVIQLNCHPFTSGPMAFMHNGRAGGFHRIRRKLLRRLSDDAFSSIYGSTDSEHVFALFLDLYKGLPPGLGRSESLARALAAAIAGVEGLREEAGVEEPSLFNIAVTDGNCAAVSRYVSPGDERANSLYLHSGGVCVCSEGRLRLEEPRKGREAVIVASEPLTGDDEWTEVASNTIVTIDEKLRVETRPISL